MGEKERATRRLRVSIQMGEQLSKPVQQGGGGGQGVVSGTLASASPCSGAGFVLPVPPPLPGLEELAVPEARNWL